MFSVQIFIPIRKISFLWYFFVWGLKLLFRAVENDELSQNCCKIWTIFCSQPKLFLNKRWDLTWSNKIYDSDLCAWTNHLLNSYSRYYFDSKSTKAVYVEHHFQFVMPLAIISPTDCLWNGSLIWRRLICWAGQNRGVPFPTGFASTLALWSMGLHFSAAKQRSHHRVERPHKLTLPLFLITIKINWY